MNFADYFQNFRSLNLTLTSTISQKIEFLSQAVNSLSNGEYPMTPLPFLPLTEEEIEDLIFLNLNDPRLETKIDLLDHQLINFRDMVRENFGIYCVLNEELIDKFAHFLTSPFLELAAGNGFLSARLEKKV